MVGGANPFFIGISVLGISQFLIGTQEFCFPR